MQLVGYDENRLLDQIGVGPVKQGTAYVFMLQFYDCTGRKHQTECHWTDLIQSSLFSSGYHSSKQSEKLEQIQTTVFF